MEVLVRAALSVRRALRAAQAPGVAVAVAALVAQGALAAPLGAVAGAVLGPCALLLAFAVNRKVRAREASLDTDVAVALYASSLAAALVFAYEPRLEGPLTASFYLLIALLAAFTKPQATVAAVIDLVATEALVRRARFGDAGVEMLAVRAGLLSAFATINVLFLRAEVARVRRAGRARLAHELKRPEDQARNSHRSRGFPWQRRSDHESS